MPTYFSSGTDNSATTDAWTQWTTGSTTWVPLIYYPPPRELPEQERQRIEETRQQYAAAEEERSAARKEAERKAEKLLIEHLNNQQKKSYKKDKSFEMQSQSGRRFILCSARVRNVEELDETGGKMASFCIHPTESIPLADQLLMQKLMLENHEKDFMRIANKS